MGGDAYTGARTLALSDGVFAIALTLLVISIRMPRLAHGHEHELLRALTDRRSELFSWLLSFGVVAVMWNRHRALFADFERLDRSLTWLNLAYLGGVAFLPYPTQVLGAYGDQPAAVGLYAVTLALISGLGGLMARHARRAGLLLADGAARQAPRPWWLIPAVVLAAIPVSFVVGGWAPLVWLAPVIIVRRSAR